MSRLLEYAKQELARIECDDAEYLKAFTDQVLEILQTYEEQDHSRFSGLDVMDCVHRLTQFKPLTPLENNDNDWKKVYTTYIGEMYEHKRYRQLKKYVMNDGSVDIMDCYSLLISRYNQIYRDGLGGRCREITFPYSPSLFPKELYIEEDDESLTKITDHEEIEYLLFEAMHNHVIKNKKMANPPRTINLTNAIHAKLDVSNLQERKHTTISSEEALKEITPIEWSDEVLEGKKEVTISKKEGSETMNGL